MTALGLFLVGAGVVLSWAGIKGEDLRQVLARGALGQGSTKAPAAPPGDPNGPGGALGQAGGRAATGASTTTGGGIGAAAGKAIPSGSGLGAAAGRAGGAV